MAGRYRNLYRSHRSFPRCTGARLHPPPTSIAYIHPPALTPVILLLLALTYQIHLHLLPTDKKG